MNRRQFTLTLSAAALYATSFTASAQSWPDKPVKLVLSQPAGSGADAMARMISDQLSKKWNQPIVVENKPGGQNAIGAQAVSRAAPDGYTFYFATAAALVTNVYLFKNLPYDPRKDFVPVGMVGKVPFAISVNASSKIKTLSDLVAYAKANPERLTVANEGPKTYSGMMTRLIGAQLGIQVNSVPYASVSAGVTDTVGGQTEVIVSDVPSIAQMVKAGRLRPLAVTTAKRIAGWESIPSLAETLPGFDYAGWIGIVAPARTPAAAIQRFNRDLDAVLSDKDMAARLLDIGPITEGAGSVDQMGAFLAAEHARWAKLTADLDILPE
ncbi:tripartite tricarboxylate transporter substrate binding protein [Variovorax ureilyticus]|uniref:Tripartite tricarboxylate transporter substrate binding protein n=1 Tax=Variovorax ureilyticus TaxID=1836198 RepID=A0ABU8VA33_9BURK